LDLSETAVHGSQHKAPCGGEGTSPNPTDRGNWASDAVAAERGLLGDIETVHLERG
jgi:hypothetical protein